MNSSSLSEWLEHLESIHPREVELGLGRISAVANILDLLPLQQPVITVAGTNGKGSTVAVLDSVLRQAGHSTGTFTSPHLLRFNERIQVDGSEVSDEEIVAAFAAIDSARGEISLTYFEFAALAALLVFRQRDPEFVILEVGLGGRLDAVNIIDPAVAVITSIDLDHQDWLGDSRSEIAREKAGILRRNTPVVVAETAPPLELRQCIEDIAAAPALYIGEEFSVEVAEGQWHGSVQRKNGSRRALAPRPCGALLPQNICAAVQAAMLLDIEFSDEQLGRALDRVAPVGRRQRYRSGGIDYVLDVAHNPAAINKLLEYMSLTHCIGKTIAVFSVMSDKDVQGMVETLAGHFDGWFLADQPANPRAAKAADVAALLSAAGEGMISISKNLRQALRRAQSVVSAGDRLVVFGSFYTVAAVLPLLQKDEKKHGVH